MQNFDTKMQIFYAFVNIYANIFGNIQKLFRLTYGCKQRFASPDKGLRSKAGAGKLWRSEAWEAQPT
jgi:hypothetical protein